jgi:hypothetical protein
MFLCIAYADLTAILTLPALRHFAQTFILTTDAPTCALTTWRFGSQRLLDLMWEWLIVWPTTGPFPQTSHTLDISKTSLLTVDKYTSSLRPFNYEKGK